MCSVDFYKQNQTWGDLKILSFLVLITQLPNLYSGGANLKKEYLETVYFILIFNPLSGEHDYFERKKKKIQNP